VETAIQLVLKVLHVTPAFYPATYYGGPMESTFGLCQALANQGHSVRVLTTDANGPQTRLDVDTREAIKSDANLEIRYCRRWGSADFSPRLWATLPATLKHVDLVHVHSVFSPSIPPAVAAARAWRKPLVWTPRGAFQPWTHRTRRMAKWVWENVSLALAPTRMAFHVTSQAEKTALLDRGLAEAVYVIPNGVDVPERLVAKPTADHVRFLVLGRLHPIKGLDDLLHACAGLLQTHGREWQLTIAGPGDDSYTRHLHDLVQRLGLTKRVHFAGLIARSDRAALFNRHDVLVAPSFTENFGMTIAEALAHGTPAIATHGTPWEGLIDHQCGWWVERKVSVLQATMQQAMSAPLQTMGRAGHAWMRSDFTWQSVAREMGSLYERLIKSS
jgi:glycosyltransferase involved in cell wall biosynthesis